MPLLCVIPARIGSTRLAEKPLRKIAGVPLITLVVRRVLSMQLEGTVVVATDDERIARSVDETGVRAIMTSPWHASGTERVAEVARLAAYREADVILNVQGDEPFVPEEAVRGALDRVRRGDPIGTAAAPLAAERAGDPNRVKVRLDGNGHAVVFSRAAVHSGLPGDAEYLQHVGVYACTRAALLSWVESPPVPEEITQRLEQLRPLARGTRIGVAVLKAGAASGVDTEEDLRNAEACLFPEEREVKT